MKAMKDFWLSLTVVFCFLAIILAAVCIASWIASVQWKRKPAEAVPPRHIRIDLRAPATFLAFGSATLSWLAYRRYKNCLRDSE